MDSKKKFREEGFPQKGKGNYRREIRNVNL